MTASDLEMLLPGDGLDGTLRTLLEPIGTAIADAIAGAPVPLAEFRKRYGCDAAFMLYQEEQDVSPPRFLSLCGPRRRVSNAVEGLAIKKY